jgi:hypothetical protein
VTPCRRPEDGLLQDQGRHLHKAKAEENSFILRTLGGVNWVWMTSCVPPTAMPAWLIPYWIADLLVTLGLVLIGIGLAGLALIWLRTRLGGWRR